jgi:hypothetical protein
MYRGRKGWRNPNELVTKKRYTANLLSSARFVMIPD